jgi:hypothetical protein
MDTPSYTFQAISLSSGLIYRTVVSTKIHTTYLTKHVHKDSDYAENHRPAAHGLVQLRNSIYSHSETVRHLI